jgi:heme/copper-type cytochrome/quinol oxidase subunit 4
MLAIRAVILVAAAAAFTVVARGFVLARWDFRYSTPCYVVLSMAFTWAVLWLSTRQLLRELKANAKAGSASPVASEHAQKYSEPLHRYPLHLRVLVAFAAIVLVALPYLLIGSTGSQALVTYIACFGAACTMFVVDLYLFLYSVSIENEQIVIKGFGARAYPLTDVVTVDILRSKNGQQIAVKLRNGEILRFGAMLTGFSKLLETLKARTARDSPQIQLPT